jgi:hypothetical protein
MAEKMPSSVKGRAPDEVEDALVFVGLQPVRGDQSPVISSVISGSSMGVPSVSARPHTTGRGAGKGQGPWAKKKAEH